MSYLLFKQIKNAKNDPKISRGVNQTMAKDTQDVIVKSKYFYKCAVKKSKRYRSAFTTEQLNYLEDEFRKFPYIGSGNRKEVANKLNIAERAVKIWFQNRRMREKKETLNRDFDSEDPAKDTTKFINEPLNNWQSNNDIRCSSLEQANRSNTKYTLKPINEATTIRKEQVCSSIPNVKNANEIVRTNNFNNSTNKPFAPTKSSVSLDQPPVTCQKVKGKSNMAAAALSKKKNVCTRNAPFKKTINNGPLNRNNVNTDQDIPQDLSSKNLQNKFNLQKGHKYPVTAIPCPAFAPLHNLPTSYPATPLPPGNMIWNPVNMMSTSPVPITSPIAHSYGVPVGIPQNIEGRYLPSGNNQNKKSCICNCHSPMVHCFNPINTRPTQYIVAIPYISPPK